MTEYGTIKIPREEYLRHNDRRDDLGLTWAEYIAEQSPDPQPDVEELVDAIGAEVGGAQVDDSALAREVAAEVDYAELAKQVADELEARQR